jgi:hypothetical protein
MFFGVYTLYINFKNYPGAAVRRKNLLSLLQRVHIASRRWSPGDYF